MKKLLFCFLVSIAASSAQSCAGSWSNGYTYCRTITINHAQVSSTLTSFPVYVGATQTTWKTAANGGHVQNTVTCGAASITCPADFIVTSDSAGTTQVSGWDFLGYSATTGLAQFRFLASSLSSSADTTFYLFYGKSAVTTFQTTYSNTYDANAAVVYHLNETAASTAIHDSTANANSGTAAANASGKTTSGQVSAGLTFNGTSDDIIGTLNTAALATYSAWVNLSNNSGFQMIALSGPGGDLGYRLILDANFYCSDGSVNGCFDFSDSGQTNRAFDPTPTSYTTGIWYHVAGVYDGTNLALYINGSSVATQADSISSSTGGTLNIGWNGSGNFLNGILNELRIDNTNRSAAWVSATYNNEKSSSTFVTIGAEQTSGARRGFPVVMERSCLTIK